MDLIVISCAAQRNPGKESVRVRVVTDSGRVLGLDSRPQEKPLKVLTLIRNVHLLAMYEKRHSNIAAHVSPCFRVKEGDHVIIGQCRPLAKTVRFNVLKVIPAGSTSGGGKKASSAV
ncbi:hypothetical protein Cni_G00298 [Canna indica]|uniref:40S ribosomal protein S11 n=1 Tax=Canna indica TaxID=4628 RepID=A0AAQ3JMH0_9LILI|nr:hypothetical protein Cni_G00298 [Canna indica]